MIAANPYTIDTIHGCRTFPPFYGPFGDVNQDFHDTYDGLVQSVGFRLGREVPVIVATQFDLTMLFRGRQKVERFVPELFQTLKSVSHVAFGLQLIIMANGEGKFRGETTAALERKREFILIAARHLADQNLPWEIEDIQVRILEMSRQFIETTLERASVDWRATATFTRELAPSLMESAAYAARLELDGIHGIVSRWQEQFDMSTWHALYVVVCGAHGPRYRHAAKQYFRRLLHEEEGFAAEREDRVIYGEGLSDPTAAKDLLARHIIDRQAAQMFFGERRRLQRDLLSDAATEYLEVLLPKNAENREAQMNVEIE